MRLETKLKEKAKVVKVWEERSQQLKSKQLLLCKPLALLEQVALQGLILEHEINRTVSRPRAAEQLASVHLHQANPKVRHFFHKKAEIQARKTQTKKGGNSTARLGYHGQNNTSLLFPGPSGKYSEVHLHRLSWPLALNNAITFSFQLQHHLPFSF